MTKTMEMDILEDRVKRMELQICGDGIKHEDNMEMVSALHDVSSKLENAVRSNSKIAPIMAKMEELEWFLDPFHSQARPDPSLLTDLLLGQEERLRGQLTDLQKLAEMKDVLSSAPIAESVGEQGNLDAVTCQQNEISESAKDQDERITCLLDNYNAILQTLSEAFAGMDEIVTKSEILAQQTNE